MKHLIGLLVVLCAFALLLLVLVGMGTVKAPGAAGEPAKTAKDAPPTKGGTKIDKPAEATISVIEFEEQLEINERLVKENMDLELRVKVAEAKTRAFKKQVGEAAVTIRSLDKDIADLRKELARKPGKGFEESLKEIGKYEEWKKGEEERNLSVNAYRAYENAFAFENEYPYDMPDVIEKYRAVINKYPGTPAAKSAQKRIDICKQKRY